MRGARLTRGSKQPILNHLNTHWPRLATIVDHLSNQNSQTHSSESGFRRNVKFATFEEADGLCKNIPHNGGKTCTLGGKSVPKLPHWLETAFQLNITLDHSVIETRGRAHLTQTTNQHLRIIVKLSSHAPSNHLEHLSNTSHRLPFKEIKGISQDRSVIETWGWARLTRGSKQPILNHLNTHWPRLATIVEHLSNQNSQRNIFHSECHREGGSWFISFILTRSLWSIVIASCQAIP